MTEEIRKILEEMERWNSQDKEAFDDGMVPFDGTFVFAARQKKIQQLKELLEAK
jgi:hypothetical protein